MMILDIPSVSVLLVEDSPGDARLVLEMLREAGSNAFVVCHAPSLREARECLKSRPYDVMLVDLTLPDSSGLDTVTQLVEVQPNAPVVVMTGMQDEALALRIVQEGAQDYLVKGQIDSTLLVRTLRHAIERNNLLVALAQAKYQQEELATHDSLTGLPNRLLFQGRLSHAIDLARRHEKQLAVMFIDLDHFKHINDSLGHNMGDLLLKTFADRLKSCLRQSDTAARFGGDEFICVLGDLQERSIAGDVAQKILNTCSQPIMLGEKQRSVTPSLGISLYPQDGGDSSTLIKHADSAMYTAKRFGRGNYQFFNAELHAKDLKRLSLEADLQVAVKQQQLAVYYQPIIGKNNRPVAVEALVRWQHPTLGLLAPADFIAIAETTGMIKDIDEWVLRTACHQVKSWHDAGLPPLRVAVNMSAQEFEHDSNLVELVSNVLNESGLQPCYLELEISETASMFDPEITKITLQKLRLLGVHLAIDDFGTGYSSLSYLQQFKVDTLKIDRAFVCDVISNPESATITRTIVALAKALNLSTVAEGVETEAQAKFLKDLQCDYLQGYHYSRPVAAAQLEKMVA
ncbi:MAG: EAL domain-containing protein [Ectothiorhodospiraceae bacterium]|nr:EAL domain-containing protein [Ectothiorhodospiraceae bacterium]